MHVTLKFQIFKQALNFGRVKSQPPRDIPDQDLPRVINHDEYALSVIIQRVCGCVALRQLGPELLILDGQSADFLPQRLGFGKELWLFFSKFSNFRHPNAMFRIESWPQNTCLTHQDQNSTRK